MTIKEVILDVVRAKHLSKNDICTTALEMLHSDDHHVKWSSVIKAFKQLVNSQQIIEVGGDFYLPADVEESTEPVESIIKIPNTYADTQFCQYTVGQVFVDPDDVNDLNFVLYDHDITKDQHIISIINDNLNTILVLDVCTDIKLHLEYLLYYSKTAGDVIKALHKGHGVSVRCYLPMERNPNLREIHMIVRIRNIHLKQLRTLLLEYNHALIPC